MFHFVYKITNLINERYYLGVHSTRNLGDGYMGSGKLLRLALKKYGVQNFEREILFMCESREAAFKKEAEVVTIMQVRDKNCYNLIVGGGVVGKPIYSDKAEPYIYPLEYHPPFDLNYEYDVRLLRPVKVSEKINFTSWGKAFWGLIASDNILQIITDCYNRSDNNKLANKFITLLERLPAFKNNIAIYRYPKTTLVKNSYAAG